MLSIRDSIQTQGHLQTKNKTKGMKKKKDISFKCAVENWRNFPCCSLNVSADGVYISATVMAIFQGRAWKDPLQIPGLVYLGSHNKDLESQVLVLGNFMSRG